ncbi:MAG TPA: dihydroorotase [Thermoleophilia bacterium]|nr:dihydroorotase [Thermoleophilia bacterium]
MHQAVPGATPRLACRSLTPEHLFLPDVHLFDPVRGMDERGSLLVRDGAIAALGANLDPPREAVVLSEVRGCHVFPGFVDMHTHLRTPGQEYKEDLQSAGRAAAAGGFVLVVGMANTDPVIDGGPLAGWVLDQAEARAAVAVAQAGAVSRGLQGESLAELRELADAGVVAFSDDGRPLEDMDLLLTALRYLRTTGRPLLLHLEDPSLSVEGVMHEGAWSARLGLRGISGSAEAGPMARDLEVLRAVLREDAARPADRAAGGAGPSGARKPAPAPRLHFQHLSTEAAVRLLRAAKAEGLPVTAEATPHHLLLTDERVASFDQSLKVNPPLRSERDRLEVVAALEEGLIDCIATDHAPHAPHEKEVPFEDAPFGTIGLETAFAALYGGLVAKGHLSLGRLIEALSAGPGRCLGIDAPRLEVGAPADLCAVDLVEEWVVTTEDLQGKSRNCAFLGERVQGRVRLTVVRGSRRFERGRSTDV